MPEPDPAAPAIDGYTPERLLGSGGFSDVYLYQQRFPRRHVAIKVSRIDTLDRELRRQFVAEANVMAQLSTHPAIATIYSADISADGRPYLVMEYCSGGSLGTGYRTTPLSVPAVVNIGVRIAAALESAHRVGIVHRDVKPANILITDYGAPVLTDFGISVGEEGLSESTVFRTEHSSTSSITTGNAGTTQGLSVPWAPPEAFDDLPTNDERSDVFSLAATLFTLLEGRSPFEVPGGSNSALHLSRRIERGEVVEGSRDLPTALTEVLRRSLSVSRDARPQSAEEFGRALQAIQKELGEPVTAFDLVGVSGDAIDEADLETRVRPRGGSPLIPPPPPPPPTEMKTERFVGSSRERTVVRTTPSAPEPERIEKSRHLTGRQIVAISIAAAAVLVVATTGTVIALAISNSSSTGTGADTAIDSSSADPAPQQTVFVAPTELIPSAFTAASPSLFTDPGFMGTNLSGVHFVSPSLNLGCAITGPDDDNLWGCYALSATWTWPDGPTDYCYDPEQVVGCSSGIEVTGGDLPLPRRRGDAGFPAVVAVVNGNAAPYTMRVLEYGQSLTYGDVTCYSESRGMTCANLRSGHGFVMSMSRNTIF